MQIKRIQETKKVFNYLSQRDLIARYKKAKEYLLSEQYNSINFKKRKPKAEDIWSFRITKKYRAFGYFDGEVFKIVKISDHQK